MDKLVRFLSISIPYLMAWNGLLAAESAAAIASACDLVLTIFTTAGNQEQEPRRAFHRALDARGACGSVIASVV